MSSITAVPRFSSLRTTRLIPFFVVAAVLGRADQAASATLTVCNTGCDHATIAGALAAATANDTVSVLDTVHTEANVAVATAVTIEGKGAAQTTVQAAVTRLAGAGPVFSIGAGVAVTIRNLTVRHGDSGVTDGGAIANLGDLTLTGVNVIDSDASRGAGILNGSGAKLTLTDVEVTGNSAAGGGGVLNKGTLVASTTTFSNNEGFVDGGGIYNEGDLTLSDSTLTENRAPFHGGGGLYNNLPFAKVTLTRCTLTGNSSPSGAGIYTRHWEEFPVELTDTAVTSNVASLLAGGILSERSSSLLKLERCRITDNTGAGIVSAGNLEAKLCTVTGNSAGGIVNGGSSSTVAATTVAGNQSSNGAGILNGEGALLTVTDSTVSGNTAQSSGGGIDNTGKVVMINSTVSGNVSVGGGGISSRTGGELELRHVTVTANRASTGGGIDNAGSTTLFHTIVAKQANGADCAGTPVTSAGYNLDSDGTCNLVAAGDIASTDPTLGALANNGGTTETHALLPGSSAIDQGDPGFTPPPANDQRRQGFPRVVNERIDIGAYEAGIEPIPLMSAPNLVLLTIAIALAGSVLLLRRRDRQRPQLRSRA